MTFQHASHAAPWLRSILPAELVAALRLGVTNAVFTIKFVEARRRSFLLLEQRSHDDETLHDTVVRYSVHLAHKRHG